MYVHRHKRVCTASLPASPHSDPAPGTAETPRSILGAVESERWPPRTAHAMRIMDRGGEKDKCEGAGKVSDGQEKKTGVHRRNPSVAP